MKHVVIVHCHYESGGVTQVVQNHVAALHDFARPATEFRIVLAGGDRTGGLSESARQQVQFWSLPALDYDELHVTSDSPTADHRGKSLAKDLMDRMSSSAMTPEDTIIHWHNHSLGKNAAAPHAIAALADQGWTLLLQVHDFAEDQRPENVVYLKEQYDAPEMRQLQQILYPVSDHVAYATLTRGDADIFRAFGLPDDRITVLPNSVRLPAGELPTRDAAMRKLSNAFGIAPESRWILYPVRGIRRKNVGEFLLLCQLLGFATSDDAGPIIGGLTLKPDTPLERASYERWRRVADKHVTNVVFDAAHHREVSFLDNLAACEAVVSTSVAEGFGMAFLEPWLAGRRVIARNLPGVTADFREAGLKLNQLYDRVDVLVDDRWSDFAGLHTNQQIEVIAKLSEDHSYQQQISQANQSLLNWFLERPDESVIAHNATRIRERFGLTNQAHNLITAYQSIREAQPIRNWQSQATIAELVEAAHPAYPCRVEQHIANVGDDC